MCTVNVMHLNHPETILPTPPPHLCENCLPQNWFLVPKRLGTAGVEGVKLGEGVLSCPAQRDNKDNCSL